jgi:hypothetical protein
LLATCNGSGCTSNSHSAKPVEKDGHFSLPLSLTLFPLARGLVQAGKQAVEGVCLSSKMPDRVAGTLETGRIRGCTLEVARSLSCPSRARPDGLSLDRQARTILPANRDTTYHGKPTQDLVRSQGRRHLRRLGRRRGHARSQSFLPPLAAPPCRFFLPPTG